uniref:Uncharacterized protein LOC102810401 n=1 Tax=Saccoglossus kowalevskii TaxID=10224 RepID=A0ABM0MRJ4_SACKO|nr:PREDICTED: uncharacterized protein LOC102810401 [Saccoglossus kowalevskii]
MDDENGGLVDPAIGEFEYLPDLRSLYDFCETPSSIECRTVLEPFTLSYETGQTVHCDLPDGLICFHEDNVSPCMNYKIRLCCPLPLENDELCVGDNLYKMVWQGSLTWHDADTQCNDLFAPRGFVAGLANLESNSVRNSVRNFIKNVPGLSDPKGKGYWIGCHDEENEGIFVWLNGEKVNVPDSAWYSYPNNKYTGNCDAKDGDQDCCQLWKRPKKDPTFKMDDVCCTDKKAFICEVQCRNWTQWMDDENGGLVDPAIGEFEYLPDLRSFYDFCETPSSIECRTVIEPFTLSYETGQTVHCDLPDGLICFHEDNVSPCMNYKIRLCCPLPLENNELCVGDNLYKMVWQGFLTWHDADTQCKDLFAPRGFVAGLANLESNSVRNSVRNFIKNVPGLSDPKGKGYWIGCHDEENEGIFVWLNGEKVNVPDSAWYSYPNNKYTGNCDAKDGDQDCCQLWKRPKNDPTFKMDDVCCTDKKAFICEVPGYCASP